MRIVTPRKLVLTGFRTFSSTQEIDLTPEAGMMLFAGDNQVAPRLGANDCGKSTIFLGIEFCLYGSPVRSLRINDLVTWGSKQTAVALLIDVDDELHRIERTGPPERVTLDGNRVEQVEINRLVGLTRRQFLNSVVFGQASPLFVDLSIPERGDLIDEVLDLQLWMRSADLAGRKVSELSKRLSRLSVEVGRTEGSISSLEAIDEIRVREEAWLDDRAGRLRRLDESIDSRNSEIRLLRRRTTEERDWIREHDELLGSLRDGIEVRRSRLSELSQQLADLEVPNTSELDVAIRELRKEEDTLLSRRVSVEQERRRVVESIEFFRDEGDCPECGQPISEETASSHIRELGERRTELATELGRIEDAEEIISDKSRGLQAERSRIESSRRDHDRLEASLKAEVLSVKREIASSESQIMREEGRSNPHETTRKDRITALGEQLVILQGQRESIEIEGNPHTSVRLRVEEELRDLSSKLEEQNRRLAHLKSRSSQLEFWQHGFRRARLFCMRRVLRQLDLDTMNQAQSMGLIGWNIAYATETETRSGTQKLGVQVCVSPPEVDSAPFNSLGGGVGQRVRLCTALGVGSLIQRSCGVRWRIEVFDEPTSWISEVGINDLLELLRNRADQMDKVICVADHRGLQHAGFNRVLTVVKGAEGSFVQ